MGYGCPKAAPRYSELGEAALSGFCAGETTAAAAGAGAGAGAAGAAAVGAAGAAREGVALGAVAVVVSVEVEADVETTSLFSSSPFSSSLLAPSLSSPSSSSCSSSSSAFVYRSSKDGTVIHFIGRWNFKSSFRDAGSRGDVPSVRARYKASPDDK